MTRWVQPADDEYSRLDHMDGLGGNLAELSVEDRRAFVDADTTIEPYAERKSRSSSLAIAASLLGFAFTVAAVIAITQVIL